MDARAQENARTLLEMWTRTLDCGDVIKPRGEEVREIRDLQITISPVFPFQSFVDRKYNFDYFRHEMRWKLTANKFDESIKQHAKMWESVQNPDGTFNSNYGQYWFGEQNGFWNVVMELIRDPDSRQAVIPMLNKDHMTPQTKDKVCTESVGFHIRNGKLHMSVHMRSSDQVFGLGTDIPTFSVLYMMVLGMINEVHAVMVMVGTITITAMSSHIYSRHYEMVKKCIDKGIGGYFEQPLPIIRNAGESMQIVASRGDKAMLQANSAHKLACWLSTEDLFIRNTFPQLSNPKVDPTQVLAELNESLKGKAQ